MLHNNEQINKSLVEMGFEEFTEIQAKTMPLMRNINQIYIREL